MTALNITRDPYADSTIISNIFIDEYMKDANDAQLKVYLFLLRSSGSNMGISVSSMADLFNHTERDIMRALTYWENKGLLGLDFDSHNQLCGIHIKPLTAEAPTADIENTSHPVSEPVKAPASPVVATQASVTPMPEKATYSLDQLKAFRENEDTAQLLFIVEQYIGTPLTVPEMKTILFFSDSLHFSCDLIDYLVQYCVDRGKKDFRYIEKVALSWNEAGITTPKEASAFSHKYEKYVYDTMKALGRTSAPTAREADFAKRWYKEYGFDMDVILEACNRSVLATDSHRMEYTDGILLKWKQANVHHLSDISRLDEEYKKKKKTSSDGNGTNKFNQFTQNSYDFDALEREILSN